MSHKIATAFFNKFTEEDLISMVLYNPVYLSQICLMLTLDIQLSQENPHINSVC
jgi:hypothetical protein